MKGEKMVQDNKWGKLFIQIITIGFTVIVSVLTCMSFFEHCEADIYSFLQERYIEAHRPILYMGMTIVGTVLLLGVCHFWFRRLSKDEGRGEVVQKVLVLCSIIISIVSIFWIFFNDATPKYDQEILFREARIMAGYLEGEYDIQNFELMPRNKGLTMVMAFMLLLLGDSMISFRILNVVGAIVLLVSISLTTKKIWRDQRVTIITALFMTIYYPIVIYTCYLYGTLLSAAFGALGVYAVINWCENKRLQYFFVALFSFPFAIQMHQSAAIVMIAAMFYMVMQATKKTFGKTLLCSIMFLAMVFSFNKMADLGYEKITGAELGDGVPTLAYLYMGLSAEDGAGGPGSQDGSFVEIFLENNCDVKATNQDALNRIVKILGEYISGERNFKFFVDKVKFQWLDPTFGSRRIIEANYVENGEPPNSEAYLKVRNSSLRNVGFKMAVVGMIITYSLNLFAAVYQLLKKEQDALHFFIQILLVGGFVFQLFWESISRYCFSYFIWLIPGAAYGLVLLYKVLMNTFNKNYDSEKTKVEA